jgi:hypothetical protein
METGNPAPPVGRRSASSVGATKKQRLTRGGFLMEATAGGGWQGAVKKSNA